jgi:integration host factor subunit beta
MLKSDLITILVQKRGVTQKQAESTVETIFESMKDALCKGENIEIRGLGAFHVKHYEGYQGRNPKTGQVIPVKPKRGILFRTGKELRDRVNRVVEASQASVAPGPVAHTPAESNLPAAPANGVAVAPPKDPGTTSGGTQTGT